MLDIKMKGENTSWQEWYEQNPRRGRRATRGGLLVHGIGVVDIDYVHSVFHKTDTGTALVYRCKFYRAWEKMLQRCYSKGWHDKYPTYLGLSVCEDFKSLQKFKSWMECQVFMEGEDVLQLDKDIMFPGNKVYSPEACVFVPQFINKTLNICERASGARPKGVREYSLKSGELRYSWQVSASEGKLSLSGFTSPESAHKGWQIARADLIQRSVDRYKAMKCYRMEVADSVLKRAKTLRTHASLGVITTKLL